MISKGMLLFWYFFMNNNNNVILFWLKIYWKYRKCNGVSDILIRGWNVFIKIYINFCKCY